MLTKLLLESLTAPSQSLHKGLQIEHNTENSQSDFEEHEQTFKDISDIIQQILARDSGSIEQKFKECFQFRTQIRINQQNYLSKYG